MTQQNFTHPETVSCVVSSESFEFRVLFACRLKECVMRTIFEELRSFGHLYL